MVISDFACAALQANNIKQQMQRDGNAFFTYGLGPCL